MGPAKALTACTMVRSLNEAILHQTLTLNPTLLTLTRYQSFDNKPCEGVNEEMGPAKALTACTMVRSLNEAMGDFLKAQSLEGSRPTR